MKLRQSQPLRLSRQPSSTLHTLPKLEILFALSMRRATRRLSENEKFVTRSRKAKILTAGIHWVF